jgi:hypothetical protein
VLTAHELFIALRPTPSGEERDLSVQPGAHDFRVYLRETHAWKWIDRSASLGQRHPIPHAGFVLEIHLDRLFPLDRANLHDTGRRYEWAERMGVEHLALAQRYRDDGASKLLDENDLAVLRAAAERWLASPAGPPERDAIDGGLASVLRALIGAGKLGGGR